MNDKPNPTTDSRAPRGALSTILKYVFRYRALVAVACVSTVTARVTQVGLGSAVRVVFDRDLSSLNTIPTPTVVAFLGAVFAVIGLSILGSYAWSSAVSRAVGDLRSAIFARLIDVHPAFFEERPPSEIQGRVTSDAAVLEDGFVLQLGNSTANAIILLGATVMLLLTNWRWALVLASAYVFTAPFLVFAKQLRGLSETAQTALTGLGTYLHESLANLRTVQANNRQDAHVRVFTDLVQKRSVAVRRVAWIFASVDSYAPLTMVATLSALIWYASRDIAAGRATGGQLASFLYYTMLAQGSVPVLANFGIWLPRITGASQRMMDLLNVTSATAVSTQPVALPNPAEGRVEFRGVTFTYPSKATAALNDVTFAIEPRQRVALVGPSGAGKSTVFELLLRFLDVQQGQVLIDGIDVRALDPTDLRAQLAIVSQQPVLFSGTVLENIRYGRPAATEAEVRAAADAAFAHDFIERLPGGYHAEVGHVGASLSGGERQRLAIARAILRDPRILLLDEAMSALDARGEGMVQRALAHLVQGRTTIVITHRLQTITRADQVIVLELGAVVANGRHADLLRTSPLYAELARSYTDDEENEPGPGSKPTLPLVDSLQRA